MLSVTVTVDEDMGEVLRAMAKIKGISVDEALSQLVMEKIKNIKSRMSDPVIGLFDNGETDISERIEDLLHEEGYPD